MALRRADEAAQWRSTGALVLRGERGTEVLLGMDEAGRGSLETRKTAALLGAALHAQDVRAARREAAVVRARPWHPGSPTKSAPYGYLGVVQACLACVVSVDRVLSPVVWWGVCNGLVVGRVRGRSGG